MDVPLPATVPLAKRKKNYLWLLVGMGLLHGLVYSYGLSHPPTQLGLELFINFTANLGLLGWCYADSQVKMIPITRWLGLALLAMPIIGVPWYFIRSRGLLGAAKAAFGLAIILIYLTVFVTSFLACEAIGGHLGPTN